MLSFTTLVTSASILFVSSNAAPAPLNLGSALNLDSYTGILSALTTVTATKPTPTSTGQASAVLESIFNTTQTSGALYPEISQLVASGLTTDNVAQALAFVDGVLDGENSDQNNNPRNPNPPAYPKAGPKDAPYDLSEETLRGAIYIPSTFQYGKKGAPQPIILVPGTGDTGYTTFVGNYIPLLQGSKIGDPVWLNIPEYLLGDAQTNAEYVAYAINYIYGISNHREVAVFSWSQGGIDSQWAFKYWPSTRNRTTDLVAFSPDFHGTVLANLIAAPGEPLEPSLLQQEYNSNFITTLRANGGDSAYVPTTTVYSGFFDEIVEPQQGTGASAYLLDARGVGVTNNEVQLVCAGQIAGSFYTHEGTLYNPLGFALAVDAIQHDGPGQMSRLNLAQVCSTYLTPGLDLTDFLLTENSILIAGIAILEDPDKVFVEPPIKGTTLKRCSHYFSANIRHSICSNKLNAKQTGNDRSQGRASL